MYKRTPLEKRLFKRGSIYHFWGHDYTGKQYTASTKQTEYKTALGVARDEEAKRSVPPADTAENEAAKRFTLGEALDLIDAHDVRVQAPPNTVRFHTDRARHLNRLLGEDRLCTTFKGAGGLKLLIKYSDKRLEEGADRHTIQKEHRVLRQALGMAKELDLYTGDPSKLVLAGFDQAVGMRGFYQVGETWLERVEWIDALIDATSSNPDRHRIDRRDDMLVIINLGLRRREPLLIMPQHVDLERRTVTIRMPRRERAQKKAQRETGTKTDKSKRVLPLNDLLLALFKRRLKQAVPGEPLFTDWGSGNRDLKANWKRARGWLLERAEKTGGKRARAELDAVLPKSLNFNDLRRTFCSLMKNAGVSIDDCAELLGHEDRAMVELVYGHTAMETLHRAVAKLPAMRLPPEPPTRIRALSRRQRQRLRASSDRMPSGSKSVSGPEADCNGLCNESDAQKGAGR